MVLKWKLCVNNIKFITMAKSEFLNNLLDAVNKGEFNSDAAKKINEINKLASIKAQKGDVESLLEKRINDAGVKTVSEEDAIVANSEYEIKMNQFKEIDRINGALRNLIEIEEMVKLTIGDMFQYINELKSNFDENDGNCTELFNKIINVSRKYENFLNETI